MTSAGLKKTLFHSGEAAAFLFPDSAPPQSDVNSTIGVESWGGAVA